MWHLEQSRGEAKTFYPHFLSQEASIVRKRKGAPPTLPSPSLATLKLKGRGKGDAKVCRHQPSLSLPLGFDSHLLPHLQNSLPLGIRCQLHFACQRSSLANFWHKILHIFCINLQVGFKRPWLQLHRRKHHCICSEKQLSGEHTWCVMECGKVMLTRLGGMPIP